MLCDKVVGDKVVCERHCVTKLWVTNLSVKVVLCVTKSWMAERAEKAEAAEEAAEAEEEAEPGYRIKNKNPTERCEKKHRRTQTSTAKCPLLLRSSTADQSQRSLVSTAQSAVQPNLLFCRFFFFAFCLLSPQPFQLLRSLPFLLLLFSP